MVIELSFSNYLIPIIARSLGLSVTKIHAFFYVYLHSFFRIFSLNSEGFANILKTKNQMTYIVVQDGMILL